MNELVRVILGLALIGAAVGIIITTPIGRVFVACFDWLDEYAPVLVAFILVCCLAVILSPALIAGLLVYIVIRRFGK